ncbi:hypothetical protein CSKR_114460 [Clonorchis sinensis]|uniref:Uncharacterized protein n=1 Tax=Clonorchis sinensis TaxID=79923 RepID=A0A3R7F826_CLOSI|nr:hypothetical protein CSKR_114460 [Clonorchis sinensis]
MNEVAGVDPTESPDHTVHLLAASTQHRAGRKELCEANGSLACGVHALTSVSDSSVTREFFLPNIIWGSVVLLNELAHIHKMAPWLEHELTERKVRGPNLTSVSRFVICRSWFR